MTVCNTKIIQYSRSKRRKVQAEFKGGDITSDGGVMLLREADRRLKLTRRIASVLNDPRCPSKTWHSMLNMLRQRVYGLSLGYEDLNDHSTLRKDPAIQTAVNHDQDLASPSTLCRFENWVSFEALWDISRTLIDLFIESFDKTPQELILDFDTTDDAVHGRQLDAVFHGYYDHYCFLPLYVFCGDKMLVAYLRPGDADNAQHAWAILALLAERLRQAWPDVDIIFRGDSGFCRHQMLNWVSNQLRLLLSSVAYTLLEALRSIALKGTQFAGARWDTMRLPHEFLTCQNLCLLAILLVGRYPVNPSSDQRV